jgi:hypothetical protein
MPLIAFLLVLLVACQPVEPLFRITPGDQQVTAGDPAITFNALLGNEPVVASWSLNPQVGNLDLLAASSVSYTPPATLAASVTVEITAVAQGETARVTLNLLPRPDTQPPQLLSVAPPDLATGVAQGTPVVLTFSETMDRDATLAALQLNGPGVANASLSPSWNAEGTVLTLQPMLSYSTGHTLQTPALTYTLGLSDSATDLAGNPIAAFSSSFTTLRRLTLGLPLVESLTGDISETGQVNLCSQDYPGEMCVGKAPVDSVLRETRSFASFDLSGLPAGVLQFEQGILTVEQTDFQAVSSPADLPVIIAEHLPFSSMNQQTFNLYRESLLGVIEPIDQPKVHTFDVALAVQQDYQLRQSRNNHTQYRLTMFLSGITTELYTLFSRSPLLEVRILIP